MARVQIDALTIAYGKGQQSVHAVNDLSLEVPGGQVLGLLGGNGAGKTSTLRVVTGLQPATSGTVTVDGFNLSSPKGAQAARACIGYCPDTGGLIRQASVREHIGVALGLRGRLDQWGAALQLVEQFGLTEALDRPTLGFSHGMSRRLSVLLATLTATSVLILDEPFDGVDPLGVEATRVAVAAARDAGLAVIISTHLLPLLVDTSDRIAVMVRGNLVDDAPAVKYDGPAGAEAYQALLRATQ